MKEELAHGIRDIYGRRKYLNEAERLEFLQALDRFPDDKRLFCLMLYWSGARISEALNLHVDQIDFDAGTVFIHSLKKRKKGLFRPVPLPKIFLGSMSEYIQRQKKPNRNLWEFSRSTAGRWVKKAMKLANISGVHACPKGLRHGFGVHAVMSNVPLTLVKKWMGHQSLKTTEIYLQVGTKEERLIAQRMWESESDLHTTSQTE